MTFKNFLYLALQTRSPHLLIGREWTTELLDYFHLRKDMIVRTVPRILLPHYILHPQLRYFVTSIEHSIVLIIESFCIWLWNSECYFGFGLFLFKWKISVNLYRIRTHVKSDIQLVSLGVPQGSVWDLFSSHSLLGPQKRTPKLFFLLVTRHFHSLVEAKFLWKTIVWLIKWK